MLEATAANEALENQIPHFFILNKDHVSRAMSIRDAQLEPCIKISASVIVNMQ